MDTESTDPVLDTESVYPENSEDIEIDDDDEEPITAKKVSPLFELRCAATYKLTLDHPLSRYSTHYARPG